MEYWRNLESVRLVRLWNTLGNQIRPGWGSHAAPGATSEQWGCSGPGAHASSGVVHSWKGHAGMAGFDFDGEVGGGSGGRR